MLGVGVHGFDGSQVASWICDANLEANMALMHEMSSPIDGAINSFMWRTKKLNKLDIEGHARDGDSDSESTSSSSSDSNSDPDLDTKDDAVPIVRPSFGSPGTGATSAIDILMDEPPFAADPAFGPPEGAEPSRDDAGADIDGIDSTGLPELAKHFLKHVSGHTGKVVIGDFMMALLRLLEDVLAGSYFPHGSLDVAAVDADILVEVCFESMADIWFRMCFCYQCFPWLLFALVLPGSFRERWIELRKQAQQCARGVDTEFSAGVFSAMPWDRPVGVAQERLEEAFRKGLLDIACKASLSSDIVECWHHSSNMQIVRQKCGLIKQALNPIHHTFATYCASLIADHARQANFIESNVLPSRMSRARLRVNYGRKGCNQYTEPGLRVKLVKKSNKLKTTKRRRISPWNIFCRRGNKGQQVLPNAWAGKVQALSTAYRALPADELAELVIEVCALARHESCSCVPLSKFVQFLGAGAYRSRMGNPESSLLILYSVCSVGLWGCSNQGVCRCWGIAKAEKENLEMEKLIATALPPQGQIDETFLASGLSPAQAKQISMTRLQNSEEAYATDPRWQTHLGLMDSRFALQEKFFDVSKSHVNYRSLAEELLWELPNATPKPDAKVDNCVHQVCYLRCGGLCCTDPDMSKVSNGVRSLEAHVHKYASASARTLLRFHANNFEMLMFLGKLQKRPLLTRSMLSATRSGDHFVKLKLDGGLPHIMTSHWVLKLALRVEPTVTSIHVDVLGYKVRRDLCSETVVVELGDSGSSGVVWDVSFKKPKKTKKRPQSLPFGLQLPKSKAQRRMPAWFETGRTKSGVRDRHSGSRRSFEVAGNAGGSSLLPSSSSSSSSPSSSSASSSDSSSEEAPLPPQLKYQITKVTTKIVGFDGVFVASSGMSTCAHCNKKILKGELRWRFWPDVRSFSRWVHFHCIRHMIAGKPDSPWLEQCTRVLSGIGEDTTGLSIAHRAEIVGALHELRAQF